LFSEARPNCLGVAILGFNHTNVFPKELFTNYDHLILKENHPKTSITSCEENGIVILKSIIQKPFHLIFHSFHNLSVHVSNHKIHNVLAN